MAASPYSGPGGVRPGSDGSLAAQVVGGIASQAPTPETPSSDYAAMSPYWEMVDAILGGAKAMRKAGTKYLPRFENESPQDYEHRRRSAPFTNVYADVVNNLAAKPFSKEMALKQDAGASLLTLSENIDGQGNSLHVFAARLFEDGINKAVSWVLVDYTQSEPEARVRSIEEERRAGLAPYWVHIPPEKLLAVYSDHVNGSEIITHARICEPMTVRDGFGEKTAERVRVFDRPMADGQYGPPTVTLYQEREEDTTAPGLEVWDIIDGPRPITLGVIPLVPFIVGKREGISWQLRPPLRDIAYLQVEEYQQESNLKYVMELTCFPMLAANGVPATDSHGERIKVPVGPKAVLFSPPSGDGKHGEWKFIEPSAESIKTLINHLDNTQKSMRDLGMMPLTTANLTVITTANVAAKAHSAVAAWALALKDALESALKLTVEWLADGSKPPEVDIHTDFAVDLQADEELGVLIQMRAEGDLSRETLWSEMRRRGVLSDNFDPATEPALIAANPPSPPSPEQPGLLSHQGARESAGGGAL